MHYACVVLMARATMSTVTVWVLCVTHPAGLDTIDQLSRHQPRLRCLAAHIILLFFVKSAVLWPGTLLYSQRCFGGAASDYCTANTASDSIVVFIVYMW